LQAATKQYVDNQVTAGIHIHEPVRVETTGNLNATYARAGATNINITGIANGTDVSFFGAIAVGDQFYTGTAVNGLLANTAYFIVNITGGGAAQVSFTFDGALVTGLTNGTFTQPAVINSGVGATLTNAGTQAALQIDSVNLAATNRVMVRLQTNGAENGVYTVTTVGDGSTNWVLTRATDSDRVNPASPDGVGTGDYYFTREGTLNAGDSHVLTTEPNTMIIGYTALTYTQFSGGVTYTGGTNIDVTGQVISVTGAIGATNGGTGASTVTTGDLLYGSGTNTWGKLPKGAAYKALIMDASAANVEWNAIPLNQSAAVSGALGATNGGTGQSTYTLGDTLYSSASNTLAKLAGNTTTTKKFLVQTGTGSVSAAPVWGTVDGADVSGNISGNAGSATVLATARNINGVAFDGSAAISVNTVNAATFDNSGAGGVSGSTFNGGSVLTVSYNTVGAPSTTGTGASGNWPINVTGSAASATTATNLAGGSAGTIPYQSAAGTTVQLAAGTAGYLLQANGAAAPTWVTAPVANNGTLTMAVSGTGLSGSASFTANQSGNSTFTVASNATNANTGSTIVARDSSGNFSAGTITAALNGNASTATTATTATTANALNTANSYTVAGFTLTTTNGYVNVNRPLASSGEVGYTWGSAGTPTWYNYLTTSSSTLLWYSNTNAIVMALTTDGKLGIGTTSPGAPLHVVTPRTSGTNAISITLSDPVTGGQASGWGKQIRGVSNGGSSISAVAFEEYGGTNNDTAIAFYTQASAGALTRRVTITAQGGLGVGTDANAGSGGIYATGNITAYYSDKRLKTVSGKIENALDKVAQLSGVYYTNNDTAKSFGYDSDEVQVGVLAQEVEAVMPEIVKAAPFDLDQEGNSKSGENYKTVQYEKLVPLLIEAINELQAKVKALEAK
jgi:hypothetical protein